MRGEYQHSIDTKGRVIFPVKLREELGEGFVIAKGLDNCISVFSKQGWEEFYSKISAMPSRAERLKRFFSANFECEPDAQGRILIPPTLRSYAGLNKDVTIVGLGGKAEIWDTEAWNKYNSEMSSEDIAALMDSMGV